MVETPSPVAHSVRVHAIDARLNHVYNKVVGLYGGACIDGSRITRCIGGVNYDGVPNWLSVQVPRGTRIEFVAIHIYARWGGVQLTPFEVWVGNDFGDDNVVTATRCRLHKQDGSGGNGPITKEPQNGVPVIVSCGGIDTGTFITLKQVGSRKRTLHVSELVVYTPPPPVVEPPALRTVPVVSELNERFAHGKPSRVHAEAGILVHMFDDYEDLPDRWRMSRDSDRRAVDNWSVDHHSSTKHPRTTFSQPGPTPRSRCLQVRLDHQRCTAKPLG